MKFLLNPSLKSQTKDFTFTPTLWTFNSEDEKHSKAKWKRWLGKFCLSNGASALISSSLANRCCLTIYLESSNREGFKHRLFRLETGCSNSSGDSAEICWLKFEKRMGSKQDFREINLQFKSVRGVSNFNASFTRMCWCLNVVMLLF